MCLPKEPDLSERHLPGSGWGHSGALRSHVVGQIPCLPTMHSLGEAATVPGAPARTPHPRVTEEPPG